MILSRSLAPVTVPLFLPAGAAARGDFHPRSSCRHRNSGWKSLNCTHSRTGAHTRVRPARCDDLAPSHTLSLSVTVSLCLSLSRSVLVCSPCLSLSSFTRPLSSSLFPRRPGQLFIQYLEFREPGENKYIVAREKSGMRTLSPCSSGRNVFVYRDDICRVRAPTHFPAAVVGLDDDFFCLFFSFFAIFLLFFSFVRSTNQNSREIYCSAVFSRTFASVL